MLAYGARIFGGNALEMKHHAHIAANYKTIYGKDFGECIVTKCISREIQFIHRTNMYFCGSPYTPLTSREPKCFYNNQIVENRF